MTGSHIFLCYSSFDKPSVRQLYRRLLADGFQPWLDKEDLVPGQDWEYEIRCTIMRSQAAIVCLSRESISKTGFVQREIRMALDAADERPEGSIYIIPARLEDCQVPQRLARWHWVDLFAENGYGRLQQALTAVAPWKGRATELGGPSGGAHGSDVTPTTTASEIISWQDEDVRRDGLYAREDDGYSQYIGFLGSGLCYTASSTGSPKQVAHWIFDDDGFDPSRGPYTILGNQVKIISDSKSGRVEYRGTIGSSARELHLYVHSHINGHESFGVWRFHKLHMPSE